MGGGGGDVDEIVVPFWVYQIFWISGALFSGANFHWQAEERASMTLCDICLSNFPKLPLLDLLVFISAFSPCVPESVLSFFDAGSPELSPAVKKLLAGDFSGLQILFSGCGAGIWGASEKLGVVFGGVAIIRMTTF